MTSSGLGMALLPVEQPQHELLSTLSSEVASKIERRKLSCSALTSRTSVTSATSGVDERGRINESEDVSRSLSQDGHRQAKALAKAGQADKGDRQPRKF